MSQQPEPWELEGDAAEAKGGDGKVSISDRVAYLKLGLGAPKVGASQGNNDEMRNAASEASQSASRQQKGGEWDRVKYALDHLKPGAPKVGSSFNCRRPRATRHHARSEGKGCSRASVFVDTSKNISR